MSNSVRPHRRQPTRLPHPWDSPGKNSGVGCHFLLRHMKVKSESEVAQSYLTLSDPMDRSPPGSSVHGIFQARVLEWGAALVMSNSLQPYIDCSPPGSSLHGILQARILEWVAMASSRGSSQPRDWTHVSYVSCPDRQNLYHWCHLGSPFGASRCVGMSKWSPKALAAHLAKALWLSKALTLLI